MTTGRNETITGQRTISNEVERSEIEGKLKGRKKKKRKENDIGEE